MKARAICIFFLMMFAVFISNAQIVVETGPDITPEDMVEVLLDEGVQFSSITFQGADVARGVFSNGDSTNLGMDSGIFLTTGEGTDIPGPNIYSSTSTNNGMPGHPTFNALTTSTTYDAAMLEFDLIPETDTLEIRWIFASEDYNNGGGLFTDVCGIFVAGPKPEGGFYADENIALVPGTIDSAVNVNTINGSVNSQYYVDNTYGLTIEFNGFTTVLTVKVATIPCEEYHLKIGVTDVGDGIFDSGIFLKMNCIGVPQIAVETILEPPGITETMLEGHVAAELVFSLPDASFSPETIYFEVGGTADPSAFPDGDFTEEIPTSIFFEGGSSSSSIIVEPSQDYVIEGQENLVFILENDIGCYTRHDTLEWIIQDYLDLVSITSPNTMICAGQQLELVVYYLNGVAPYTVFWEPGSVYNDTITISPMETTMYYAYVTDVFQQDTVVDSVLVTVFPNNYEIAAFSFDLQNNPGLPWTVTGQVFEDSVALEVPPGTNLTNLVATWDIPEGSWIMVDGVVQENGVTPNDFTDPLVYHVIAPGGCSKEWTIGVDLVTGTSGLAPTDLISIWPNPACDGVIIRNARGCGLRVANQQGIVFLESDIENNWKYLDLGSLENGMYIFTLTGSGTTTQKKVVVK